MKRPSILLVAAAVAFLGNIVLAQESAGVPDEILNELNYIAGTWETEGKVGDKEQTGRFTCRWARTDEKKKVCLIGRFSYKTGDEVRSGVTLIGWNAAKKCIEVAERKPEWRAEVPLFIAKIKDIFEPWQIAEFLETPRRLGALGHTADKEGHELFRSQVDESDNVREDTRNLMLLEWARELLLGGDEVGDGA